MGCIETDILNFFYSCKIDLERNETEIRMARVEKRGNTRNGERRERRNQRYTLVVSMSGMNTT